MSSPSKMICPEVGISKPAIIRSVVVFPQPEGPSKVTNSPRLMFRLAFLTASFAPYVFVTFLISMMLSDISSP